MSDTGLVTGADGRPRCFWGASAPEYTAYHDTEWGQPVRTDDGLFERLTLEAFQSGLAWITILRKRESFRRAFDGFAIEKVAAYSDADADRLMADAGIVRNRMKIDAALHNARVAADLPDGLAALLWSYAPAPRPRPATPRRNPRADAGAHRHGQGPQEARLQVRRSDHRLCADAGHRHGRRPHR